MNPLLLLRTLGPLRWEQLVYRPVRIAQYRIYRQLPSLARLPRASSAPLPDGVALLQRNLREQFVHLRHAHPAVTEGSFTFLNRTLEIDGIDWNRRYESHLWNYHLHYFDQTVGAAFDFAEKGDDRAMLICQRMIESWMREARIGVSDGWDAYPISLRAVNWIYAWSLIEGEWPDRRFIEKMAASIYAQLDFLSRHLELHLLANHLLKNIRALVVGGIFFGKREWIETGARLLWREFDEQVLDDGGQFERSPMYHAQTTADFLECFALLGEVYPSMVPAGTEERLRGMAGFLEAMTGPDGGLALFNDSANTEQYRPGPLLDAAELICGYRRGAHLRAFPSTGYFSWASDDGNEKMIVDGGPPSVGYNAAHAHCDLLSYVLWMDGHPLVVDSGVHGYGGDRYREYCRSTRAHNTVLFDGIEQSEIWGTFRMGRPARPFDAAARADGGRWSFNGSFSRFDGRITHRRSIERDDDGKWTITDSADAATRADSFIHLHPELEVTRVDERNTAVECRRGNMVYRIAAFGADRVDVISGSGNPVQGWHFPDFGIAQESPAIRFSYQIEAGRRFGYTIVRNG